MDNYIFTYEDGVLYRNGIKVTKDMDNKISKIKYDYNAWDVYCEHCKHPVDIEDEYCVKCGYKLEFDEKENQKFMDEYDKQKVHPYGWPLTEENIVYSIGKPIYVNKHNGDYQWKVVNKIEINDSGYIIKFTDGSNHSFYDTVFYDPTNIVKNKLYPKVNNKKEEEIGTININSSYIVNHTCFGSS